MYDYAFNLKVAIFSIVLILFTIFYFKRTRNYDYWKMKHVLFIKPIFPFGSVTDIVLGRTYLGRAYDKMYKEFSKERFFGIIDTQHPVLVIRDPDLIKAVLTKDFNYFSARTNLKINQKEYILRHCINMQGEEWREMRAILSPAFTSGKVKKLYELMEKCSENLEQHISQLIMHDSEIEIFDLLARFSLDMIATSAFGFETNSINNPKCEFFVTTRNMLQTSKSRFFRRTLTNIFPVLVKLFSVTIVPRNVTNTLTSCVREIIEFRKKNNIVRNDFLNSLMNARNVSSGEDFNKSSPLGLTTGLSIEQITAQAFTFFIAGFSTNTSNMTFCLNELSRHQDIQEKLFTDIKQALDKHQVKMSYKAILDMTYLDQVILETLRLYGSGQTLTRICTKHYTIPGSDVTLEKGTRILIPIYSLHHDPQYFPNPYSFEPERFNSDLAKNMHPYVYLPFGEGPRNCIARNVGLLQMKLGIATVISNFKVNLVSKEDKPIDIDKRSFVLTPAHPVYLKFTKR